MKFFMPVVAMFFLFGVFSALAQDDYLGPAHASTVSFNAFKIATCMVAPDSITVIPTVFTVTHRESYHLDGLDKFLSDTTSVTGKKVHHMRQKIVAVMLKKGIGGYWYSCFSFERFMLDGFVVTWFVKKGKSLEAYPFVNNIRKDENEWYANNAEKEYLDFKYGVENDETLANK